MQVLTGFFRSLLTPGVHSGQSKTLYFFSTPLFSNAPPLRRISAYGISHSAVLITTILVIVFLSQSGCQSMSGLATPPIAKKPPASNLQRLRVLHFNDFHAQNRPYRERRNDTLFQDVGGIAYLAFVVDSIRRVTPYPVMVFNGGDNFQGTPISSETKGLSSILLLNRLMPEAVTTGNHEFDYGFYNYLTLLNYHATFPTICANLFYSGTDESVFPPFSIHDFDSLKIAVIGLLTNDLPALTLPTNMEGVYTKPYDKVLPDLLMEIKANHRPDVIVVVSHIGKNEDTDLARRYPDIAAYFGGHSHTPLFRPKVEGYGFVAQAGSRTKYLGVVDLLIDTAVDSLISIEGSLLPIGPDYSGVNQSIADYIDSLELPIEHALKEVIGVAETDLIRKGNNPSALGYWLALQFQEGTQSDIGIQNSGGIRSNIYKGDITKRHIYDVSPFGNEVVTFTLSGAELASALLWQLQGKGEFCDVSGIEAEIDTVGGKSALRILRVGQRPFEQKAIYSAATNNFVLSQLNTLFGLSPTRDFTSTGKSDTDFIISHVRLKKKVSSELRFWGKTVPATTSKKKR